MVKIPILKKYEKKTDNIKNILLLTCRDLKGKIMKLCESKLTSLLQNYVNLLLYSYINLKFVPQNKKKINEK